MNIEQKILQKTYQDRITVTRKSPYEDEHGETRFREEVIFDNEPCGLSKASAKASDRGERYFSKDNEFVVFADPKIVLLDNDIAMVNTAAGQSYQGRTGRTFCYSSHGETVLRVEAVV